jgi:hypothetical protein
MTLLEYFNKQFRLDLNELDYRKKKSDLPNNSWKFNIDDETTLLDSIFLSNHDFDIFLNATKNIDKENLDKFYICLFTINIIDIGIYTHYNEIYDDLKRNTMFSKINWHKNSNKINQLIIENNEIIRFYVLVKNNLKDFIELITSECNKIGNINESVLLNKILNGKDFHNNYTCNIYKLLENKLDSCIIKLIKIRLYNLNGNNFYWLYLEFYSFRSYWNENEVEITTSYTGDDELSVKDIVLYDFLKTNIYEKLNSYINDNIVDKNLFNVSVAIFAPELEDVKYLNLCFMFETEDSFGLKEEFNDTMSLIN